MLRLCILLVALSELLICAPVELTLLLPKHGIIFFTTVVNVNTTRSDDSDPMEKKIKNRKSYTLAYVVNGNVISKLQTIIRFYDLGRCHSSFDFWTRS